MNLAAPGSLSTGVPNAGAMVRGDMATSGNSTSNSTSVTLAIGAVVTGYTACTAISAAGGGGRAGMVSDAAASKRRTVVTYLCHFVINAAIQIDA